MNSDLTPASPISGATAETASGLRTFLIDSRHPESDIITSFVLKPEDGLPPPPHQAGQHLTLFADVPGKGRQKRNYTISCAPNGKTLRISVKREEKGTVSRWLHDEAQPGARLTIAPPGGSFVLPASPGKPVVMVSAGVGLTPMVAMLEEIVRRKSGAKAPITGKVQYIHVARDGAVHAFGQHVRDLAHKAGEEVSITTFYSNPRAHDVCGRDYNIAGRPDIDWLSRHTPLAEADYYVCGPLPFLKDIVPGLTRAGVEPSRIHYEFFGAVEDLFGDDGPAAAPQADTHTEARHARAIEGFTREQIGSAFLDSAADAVIVSDAAGKIVLWNAGADRIFGFTEDEALGASLDIIIPETLRQRHWDGYHETVASGQSRYGAGDLLAVPGLRKDGSRISLEFTIVLLKDEAGRVTGMASTLRDVTARFEETRALKKKIKELAGE